MGIVAALIAGAWMLLPINLTGVLYVVQRMESMANVFVLLGLIGYVAGRRRMLTTATRRAAALGNHGPDTADAMPPTPQPIASDATSETPGSVASGATTQPSGSVASGATAQRLKPFASTERKASNRGFVLCVLSITLPAAIGILAKETAVMLPLYALLIEWALFRFSRATPSARCIETSSREKQPRDVRLMALFGLVLALPLVAGLAWMLPHVLDPTIWATRDFSLGTRLLTEARIVIDYIVWTLAPSPGALSFYHDDFTISTGLLTPWTTLASIVGLVALMAFAVWVRARRPLLALGITLFLGCQLLTATILPLELIYEHRNYFASFGLLLALVPVLAAPREAPPTRVSSHVAHDDADSTGKSIGAEAPPTRVLPLVGVSATAPADALPLALPRYVLLAGLLLSWTGLSALTAYIWGNPLRLAQDLASRAPESPRAQYELGRTYIIYSQYDPASPFTALAYAPLEAAALLPKSSILPQQALIFLNSHMHLPLKDAWWDSLTSKLATHSPGVQDESALDALAKCAITQQCQLPQGRMVAAFTAALAHPHPSARLLSVYGNYAWSALDNHPLGEQLIAKAVAISPDEPAYRITLVRVLAAQGRTTEARAALQQLEALNYGGRLNRSLAELRQLPDLR